MPVEASGQVAGDAWVALNNGQALTSEQMEDVGRLIVQSEASESVSKRIRAVLIKILPSFVEKAVDRKIAAKFIDKQNQEFILERFSLAEEDQVSQAMRFGFISDRRLARGCEMELKEFFDLRNVVADIKNQGEGGWYARLGRSEDTNPALVLDLDAVVAHSQAYESNKNTLHLFERLNTISKQIDTEIFVQIVNEIVGNSEVITEAHLGSIEQEVAATLAAWNQGLDGVSDQEQEEIDQALEASEGLAIEVDAHSDAQTAFVDGLCIEHGWAVREAVDDGDCLFGSCFDEGRMTPEKLREGIFDHMEKHRLDYIEDLRNVLREDVDEIAGELDAHRRETKLGKLPDTIQAAMRELTELRANQGSEAYEAAREAWLEGTAFDDYIFGMKFSKNYPGLLEVRALAEVLQRPIRVFTKDLGIMDAVPAGSDISCDDPNAISIVYDAGRKHFDRFVPRPSEQESE